MSLMKKTLDKPESSLKRPLAALPGTVQVYEFLHGSPWKAEKFYSQVSK